MNHKQHMLNRLPPSPSGKSGWPWTAEPAELPVTAADIEWPRITIVTPSYNQGQFIEETIRSILLQNYPNLEYIIVDGGSTDGSIEIIKKYEPWLAWWVSEPDAGMYDAINKGFARSTGDIMAWSPTADLYLPGAFKQITSIFCHLQDVEWLTSLHKVKLDKNGMEVSHYRVNGFSRKMFMSGYHNTGESRCARYCIAQQSTFWRRPLWNRTGGYIDKKYRYAGDFDLWARFFQVADLYALDAPIGIFRIHANQASRERAQLYLTEQERSFHKAGGRRPSSASEWIRNHFLRRRFVSSLAQMVPGLVFTTKIISLTQSGRWQIERKTVI